MPHVLRLSLAIFSLLTLAPDAHALFTLQAQPRRGGQGIYFEASKPGVAIRNEEVTISITSDEQVQYRIYQTVYQPLTNEKGDVIPQEALVVFSPSNPLGTLRTQLETPVTMGQVPIFASNAAGDSDSFVLAFHLLVPENQPGGVYHTRITYTMEPAVPTSGLSAKVVNLDVRAEIRQAFRVTVASARGAGDLQLGKITQERPTASETLKIEIESNIGEPYQIIQEMAEPLVTPDGIVLEDEAFAFEASKQGPGTLRTGAAAAPVPDSAKQLYASSPSGDGDFLTLVYTVNPSSNQKAGIYSGTLRFRIESSSMHANRVFNLPVRVEIEPMFYLDVRLEQGGALHFGVFKTGEEKQERRVLLTVNSNLGQPYQLSQVVSRRLTSESGVSVPREHFTVKAEPTKTGVLLVRQPAPVREGETALFTSNNQGDPETLTLNYNLSIPREMRAGNYTSDIKYSITTL